MRYFKVANNEIITKQITDEPQWYKDQLKAKNIIRLICCELDFTIFMAENTFNINIPSFVKEIDANEVRSAYSKNYKKMYINKNTGMSIREDSPEYTLCPDPLELVYDPNIDEIMNKDIELKTKILRGENNA